MPTTRPCPRCSAQVPAGSRFCQKCGAGMDAPGKRRGATKMKIFVAGAAAVVVAVAALLIFMNTGKPSPAAPALTGNTIPGAGPIPSWLHNADSTILAEYAWAAGHWEELRYIPCYCGCNSVGHTDNASCYFRRDKDGTILGYDAHALG